MNAIDLSTGRHILSLLDSGTSTNYLGIENSATTDPITLSVAGTGANAGMQFIARNDGLFTFYTTNSPQINVYGGGGANYLSFPQNGSTNTYTFQDATGVLCFDTSNSGFGSGSITTAPPASTTSSMTIGSYQNPENYDVMLTIYLDVTASTADTISLLVSSDGSGTLSTIVSNLTVATSTIIPIPIYIPASYTAVLEVGGTVTATVSGQIQIPI